MATAIHLAANIAQLRKGRGITQDELATYLGVTKASVSKWETGQSFPDIALLPQIANYFGISIDGLIGYAPQLSKNELAVEAKRLREQFAREPFAAAHEACQELAREYYACPRVLLEVASIYINHLPTAPDEAARADLANEAIALCRRARSLEATTSELRMATAIEAAVQLMLGNPSEAIGLLDSTQVIDYNESSLLASAYAMLGNPDKSEETLQATVFQSLIIALNALCQMANLPTTSTNRVHDLHRCAIELIEAFDLDATYANSIAFHASFATAYAMHGETGAALECLERYVQVCEHLVFPLTLYRGNFFDQLEAWMEEQDVTFGIPRDDDLIKASLLTGITQNPAFASFAGDKRFKHIVKRIEVKTA